MDTLRKVTHKFDTEFERWVRRTKQANGFRMTTDRHHKLVRRALMDILGKNMQEAQPVSLKRQSGRGGKFRYKSKFKRSIYEGFL